MLEFEKLLKIFQRNNIKNLIVSIGFGFRNIAQLFQLINCCPNLSSLSLTKCYEIDEKHYLKRMEEKSGPIGSWKNLKASCYSDVVNILHLFPYTTRLDLHLNSNSRIKIPLFQLMPRLQTLYVYIYRMSGQEYISELIKLKYLMSLTFECLYYYSKNAEIKQDLSFQNLCQLKTHKAVFDCSNWVVPWLRKVFFQQCFSLDKLSSFNLLKELVLEECTTEMLANLFARNLFNNSYHLNSIRIGYDSNPSEIF